MSGHDGPQADRRGESAAEARPLAEQAELVRLVRGHTHRAQVAVAGSGDAAERQGDEESHRPEAAESYEKRGHSLVVRRLHAILVGEYVELGRMLYRPPRRI